MTELLDLTTSEPLDRRYEIVLLFDVSNGNPNGDPDADNAPRIDPETGHGLITDVCIKRKIRNFVAITKGMQPPHDIYVKERGILANEQRKAYQAIGLMEGSDSPNDRARTWMCQNFYDVRTFGAVMSTGKSEKESPEEKGPNAKTTKKGKLWNCGQVRGAVQFGFGRSIDPITPIAHAITRVALTNAGDTKRSTVLTESGEEKAGSGQMGRKHAIPYALYRMHGFVSPFLAKETGFTKADLGTLLESLEHMFDLDRSAARAEMEMRALFVFEHASMLGNAPAHKLFEAIKVESRDIPRSFAEYGFVPPKKCTEVMPGVRLVQYV